MSEGSLGRLSEFWERVAIVPFAVDHVEAWADYWYRSPHSEHVRRVMQPPKDGDEIKFRERWLEGAQAGAVTKTVVATLDGNPIGAFGLLPLREEDADIHAHFWEPNARGQGIGLVAVTKAARALIEAHNLSRLLLKPPKENPYSSRAARKLGLRHLGEEILTYEELLPGIWADVYEMTAADVSRLEAELRVSLTPR